MTKSAKKHIYLILSLLTSIAIFSYLLRHVSPAEIFELIRDVNLNYLLAFFILSITMSILRTWRYKLLLGISGYRPKSTALFLVVLVRNFFSDLLPARDNALDNPVTDVLHKMPSIIV